MDLLYSVRETFDDYLKGGMLYSIPAYQRGYKWEKQDIKQLLDDVNKFDSNKDDETFYCLQNITLVENKHNPNQYNVVDGQQRLTTLSVILSFLKEYKLISNKIVYSVREETEDFLKKYIYQENNLADFADWNDFLNDTKAKGLNYNFQDIYYLYSAYNATSEWFARNDVDKETFTKKLLDRVKVIVNLVKNIDEQELFENLNGKRVPLDGADLIRAVIITRIAKKEVPESEDELKYNVLVNEKRTRIGITLDTISRWWTDKNRQIWFRYFIRKVKSDSVETVDFDEKKHEINYLYKLYALAHNISTMSVRFFENEASKPNFLQHLLDFQRMLKDWYEDAELYHLILYTYLYSSSSLSFQDICTKWSSNTRQSFIHALKKIIRDNDAVKNLLGDSNNNEMETGVKTDSDQQAFLENWYNDQIVDISVLLDIVHLLYNNHMKERLPALYFQWVRKDEDREHIFPQTPISDKVKNPDKQTQVLMTYVRYINKLKAVSQDDSNIIDEDDLRKSIDWQNEEWRHKTKEEINSRLAKLIPINSIGNICLLNCSVNRSYGNDFFLEKRIDIMRKSQEGYYIRPHVFEAFNKMFLERQEESIDMNQMTLWGKDDILKRRNYIIQQITKFLDYDNEKK